MNESARRTVRPSPAQESAHQRAPLIEAATASKALTQLADVLASATFSSKLASTAEQLNRAGDARFARGPNVTGIPDKLKSGVERLSGRSMDHVRVHYNSPLPAQLHAHAFARGSHIHLGPGQDHHLPHETWHVVQQAEGRVKPTLQAKGIAINDDSALEREADRMGDRALSLGDGNGMDLRRPPSATGEDMPVQRVRIASPGYNQPWEEVVPATAVFGADHKDVETSLLTSSADRDRVRGYRMDQALRTRIENEWRAIDATAWVFRYSDRVKDRGVVYAGKAELDPRPAVPAVWKREQVLAGPPVRTDQTLADWMSVNRGGGERSASDNYNPHGRFSHAEHNTMIAANLDKAGEAALYRYLAARDPNFVPHDDLIPSGERTASGYPRTLTRRSNGAVLHHVPNADYNFGAHYTSALAGGVETTISKAQPSKKTKPKVLKSGLPDTNVMFAIDITPGGMPAKGSRDDEKQQAAIMGCSAAAVAVAAGLPFGAWEWLHLVSYGMGGPQAAANLVAGTHEANSQMIVAEEIIKEMVSTFGTPVKLFVLTQFHDSDLRVGRSIQYRAIFNFGGKEEVYLWNFDCLSRRQPDRSMNLQVRAWVRARVGLLDHEPVKGKKPAIDKSALVQHDPKAGEQRFAKASGARTPHEQILADITWARELEADGDRESAVSVLHNGCVGVAEHGPWPPDTAVAEVVAVARELPQAFRLLFLETLCAHHPSSAFLEPVYGGLAKAGLVEPSVLNAMMARALNPASHDVAMSIADQTVASQPSSQSLQPQNRLPSGGAAVRSETTKNGNCLFQAVNILLGNSADMDGVLRQMCTDYFIANPALAQVAGVSAANVVATLATPGRWRGDAGDLSPAILASVIRRHINIHTVDRIIQVESAEGAHFTALDVYLANDHYTVQPPFGFASGKGRVSLSASAKIAEAKKLQEAAHAQALAAEQHRLQQLQQQQQQPQQLFGQQQPMLYDAVGHQAQQPEPASHARPDEDVEMR